MKTDEEKDEDEYDLVREDEQGEVKHVPETLLSQVDVILKTKTPSVSKSRLRTISCTSVVSCKPTISYMTDYTVCVYFIAHRRGLLTGHTVR